GPRKVERNGQEKRPTLSGQQCGRVALAARQAPLARYRPGAQSARRDRRPPVVPRTNLEKENLPCHSPVGCGTSAPPSHLAGQNASTRGDGHLGPQLTGRTSKFWK